MKKQRWSRSIKKKVPASIAKGRECLMDVIYYHKVEELDKIIESGVELRALDPEGAMLIKAVELGYVFKDASNWWFYFCAC